LRILKNFPARLDEIAREKALESNKIEIWFQTRLVLARRTKSPAAGQSAAPARALPLISCRCNSPSLKRPDLTPRRETRSAPIRKRILPNASCAWQICRLARWIASAATNTRCGGKRDRSCLRWSRCGPASRYNSLRANGSGTSASPAAHRRAVRSVIPSNLAAPTCTSGCWRQRACDIVCLATERSPRVGRFTKPAGAASWRRPAASRS
jgi:hypothetical protein